jgi:hypothetical protein
MFAAKQGFGPLTNFGNNAFFNGGAYLSVFGIDSLINLGNPYTLEFWFTISGSSFDNNMGPGNHNSTNTTYWGFGVNPNGSLQISYYLNQTISTTSNVCNPNTWNNLCLVSDGSSVRFYLNGVRQLIQKNNSGSFSTTQSITNSRDVNIPFSMGLFSGGNWNTGYMDNLRVSNIARYSGASYNLATDPFVNDANTELLLICNSNLNDSSSYNRTVVNNGVTIATNRVNHS